MPLNRDDLSAACRMNDQAADAGGNVPSILVSLGVEPMDAIYVAEQRALRVAMLHSGTDPSRLLRAAQEGSAFAPRLHKRQRDLIPVYAGIWTDGLAAGVRAYHDALSL